MHAVFCNFAFLSEQPAVLEWNTFFISALKKSRNFKKEEKQKEKRTWTREFVCLSETNTNKVPTKEEKHSLIKAGLGHKKIQFYADDSEEGFQ